MPIPSISFRLAIVAMLVVLGVWFGYFTAAQHDILIMHFAGSIIAQLVFVPLPFAALAAFIGWNRGYFVKTYVVMFLLWVAGELFAWSQGVPTRKNAYVDLEATIMSIMIIVTVWFGYELFHYIKGRNDKTDHPAEG